MNLEHRLLAALACAVHLACDELADILFMNPSVAVGEHGAELENGKLSSVLPQALLLEEHGTLGGEFNRKRHCGKNRR